MKKHFVFIVLIPGIFSLNSMKSADEAEVIAKYLISLSRYIEWPQQMKSGNFKVGVIGDFKVYKAIAEETMGTGIQNRNVDIINLSQIEQVNITDLNILVITKNLCSPENIKKALQLTSNKPTLIVTDKEGAINYGSAINFIQKDGQIGFELNKTNAKRNGIQISNQIDVFALQVSK